MTKIITVSASYLLHVSVSDVPSTREKHLKIESQWLGAKNPEERQTKFAVTLPAHMLSEIAQAIQESL